MKNLNRTFVSDKRQFIWIANPKCGTTTIKEIIARDEGLQDEFTYRENALNLPLIHGQNLFKNVRANRFKKGMKEVNNRLKKGYFLFAFVRNPLSRLLSAYANKINQTMKFPDSGS